MSTERKPVRGEASARDRSTRASQRRKREARPRVEPDDTARDVDDTDNSDTFVSPEGGLKRVAESFTDDIDDDTDTGTEDDEDSHAPTVMPDGERAVPSGFKTTVPPPASGFHSAKRKSRKGDATELEPEADDFQQTDTDSPARSQYPGQMSAVRAPGWDQSTRAGPDSVKRRRKSGRHRPGSAPELHPSESPSLQSEMPDHPRSAPDKDDTGAETRRRAQYNAVDAAAKELARAALHAEIEREEKRAMGRYEPEEGEVPPSPEVAKRFDVVLQLGRGGMAVVYLCRDPRRNGKILAVKDIRAELKPGMKVEQRVEHEAMLLKQLNHKGIVKVYDFLKFPRSSAIVMEYIDGLPLDHEIGAGRRIAWDFAARVLKEIGEALEYAHRHGVIHRDIKPDNILWSERHNVMKLVDFGLARLFGETPEIQMTRTGMVVGTPHYMSPEQVSGRPLDPRSDMYSLGATIYYLLTGQRHVEGSNVMDILEQQRSKNIKPPGQIRRDVPAFLSYVIGKMMEINPADRYQTMQEVVDDLVRAMKDPETFLRDKPPIKRFAGAPLAPFADRDSIDEELSALVGDRTTNRIHGRRTTRNRSDSTIDRVVEQMLEEDATPAQISSMLKEISARLERAEKRLVGPGMLVLIILLCVLIVVLAIVGAIMFAAREGYLYSILGI